MKLVVETDTEFDQALVVFERLVRKNLLDRDNAFIQPEWKTRGMNVEPFVQRIFENGFRLSTQTHKMWGIY